MKKTVFFLIIITSFLIILILLFNNRTQQTITFFPIDYDTFIDEKETELSLSTHKGNLDYQLNWQSHSKTNKPLYIRQDVSLLYDNGKLKGVKSQWENNVQTIDLNMAHNEVYDTNTLWDVISYHHGEVHDSKDTIKSVHFITRDSLYVFKTPKNTLRNFHKAKNQIEKGVKKDLDSAVKIDLIQHWNNLIQHFDIQIEDYMSFPLTEINKFNTMPFPTFNQNQTDQIIGRMWEGLYKNYILSATESKQNKLDSYIPIILLAKNSENLIVLYELNGKKEILIQRIPD